LEGTKLALGVTLAVPCHEHLWEKLSEGNLAANSGLSRLLRAETQR